MKAHHSLNEAEGRGSIIILLRKDLGLLEVIAKQSNAFSVFSLQKQ